jgi:endoglycosylceramidase
MSGSQKAAPYLDDKLPADYARVRDAWGMNALRFVMPWAAIEPEPGHYDDAYLDQVAERIGWAADHRLLVVLDMHQDVYGEGFGFDGAPRWTCDEARYAAFVPMTPWYLSTVDPNVQSCFDELYTLPERKQHFVDAWRHVAARLAAQPAVIGFDVLNEPSWGSYPVFQFEPDRLAPFYEEVVAAVREEAPQWIAFLEPSASRNVGFATQLRPFDLPDVMYAPHSYDNTAESGGGFDPARRQMVLDHVAELAGEAKMLGAGLWIGEYGGVADDPGIVDYMTAEYDAAGLAAAGTMYWAYDKSDGYGLLDPAGNEKPMLLGALVRPYPERVAGDPISYAFDAATSTFTFTYMPRAASQPTVIAVPTRSYPAGFHVECDGCTYHTDADALIVDSPPTRSPAQLTLTP